MNVLVQLAWSFIEGLLFPWKFVVLTAWNLFWWTTLSGIALFWRILSFPLRIVTAAWREQQAEEKVVVLQSKIETMALTILDLEKNLEIAQTERLRMRDKLEKALDDRKNFYERAVHAIEKSRRLKKAVAERYQIELLERGTDADSDRPETDTRSEAHVDDGDDRVEHVQSEDAGVEQEQGPVLDASLSDSQEVKQSANSNEDTKPNDICEDERLIDESDSQTGGPSLQKAEKVKVIRSPDNKMRTAGAVSSILCAVLAFFGALVTIVTSPLGGNSRAAYGVVFGLISTVLLAICSAFLFFKARGKSKRRRGLKGKADSGGINAVLMLSLVWLCLGFLAFPVLRDTILPATKGPAAGMKDIWQNYCATLAPAAEKLFSTVRMYLGQLRVGVPASKIHAMDGK